MSDFLFRIVREGGEVKLNNTTAKKRVIRPSILVPCWLVCKTLLQPSRQQHLQFSTCTFKHFGVFALVYRRLFHVGAPTLTPFLCLLKILANKEIRKGTRVRCMGHLCRGVLPLYSVTRWICWEGTGILCEPHSLIMSLRKPANESTRPNRI